MSETLSKAKRNIMASLSERKMRRRHGLFMIEGRKSVEDIIFRYPERFEIEWIAASGEWIAENLQRYISPGVIKTSKIFEASAADLCSVSSLSTPADVIAVCRIPDPSPIPERLPKELYLLLDGVQDPGNVGTIIRTAHWFGIRDIFLTRTSADVFNPKVIQSSMGSLAAVETHYIDAEALIENNPELPLIGLLLEGENIFTSTLPDAGIIVMGNEGNGISGQLRRRITLPLTIPPTNPANHSESLNVAIATAITLALFRR